MLPQTWLRSGYVVLLDCLRTADTPVSTAIREQDDLPLLRQRLVEDLDVDSRTPTVANDVALFEIPKENRSRAASCRWHTCAVLHWVTVEEVLSAHASPHGLEKVGLEL